VQCAHVGCPKSDLITELLVPWCGLQMHILLKLVAHILTLVLSFRSQQMGYVDIQACCHFSLFFGVESRGASSRARCKKAGFLGSFCEGI
jgi:hypothetical protein